MQRDSHTRHRQTTIRRSFFTRSTALYAGVPCCSVTSDDSFLGLCGYSHFPLVTSNPLVCRKGLGTRLRRHYVIRLQLPECFGAIVFSILSFVKNCSCVTQICITKIAAKCILVVVWGHQCKGPIALNEKFVLQNKTKKQGFWTSCQPPGGVFY